jgi:hypothetical protein
MQASGCTHVNRRSGNDVPCKCKRTPSVSWDTLLCNIGVQGQYDGGSLGMSQRSRFTSVCAHPSPAIKISVTYLTLPLKRPLPPSGTFRCRCRSTAGRSRAGCAPFCRAIPQTLLLATLTRAYYAQRHSQNGLYMIRFVW